MENDIVLTNKVYEFGIVLAPVIGPLFGEFFGSGNITNGGVEPNVQHFAFGIGQGHLYAPAAVAGHGAALQTTIEPAFTLSIYVVLPFGMAFQDPAFQPLLIVLQWEIPVCGL